MPHIPESERKEIIERLKSGLPARQITRNFSRSPESVIKLRKKFWRLIPFWTDQKVADHE